MGMVAEFVVAAVTWTAEERATLEKWAEQGTDRSITIMEADARQVAACFVNIEGVAVGIWVKGAWGFTEIDKVGRRGRRATTLAEIIERSTTALTRGE